MADQKQLSILKRGVTEWNKWRGDNPAIKPDLRNAYLVKANLDGANLAHADLFDANFFNASLHNARMLGANLQWANFRWADLSEADLSRASLIGAKFQGANLRAASLVAADLSQAEFVETCLDDADLSQCRIFGISAWDLELRGTIQNSLVISRLDAPIITVDNLEVAQFVYLLLNNSKIRNVIDTVGKKAVLILGRFTPERKAVLDAIRDELRKHDYLSIMFDFERPDNRNYIETVSTLAHLARFIVADVTDAKVILQELQQVIPALPSVPVQPIIQKGTNVNAVIGDFVGRLNFISRLWMYEDIEDVRRSLQNKIIAPAEATLAEMEIQRKIFLEQMRMINAG